MKKLFTSIVLASVLLMLALAAFAQSPAAPQGTKSGSGVRLTWQPPKDVEARKVAGYNLYRSEEALGHYEKVNKSPLKGVSYDDRGLVKGRKYYYRVTTIFADGSESPTTAPVGMEAGAAPGTPELVLPVIEFLTSDALGRVTYVGEDAVFVLHGTHGLSAVLDITDVASGIVMTESEPGTYRCTYKVPAGLKVKDTFAVATLSDKNGGRTTAKTPATISLLGEARPSLAGLYVGILEADRVGLNWPKSQDASGYYNVYRDTSRIVGTAGMRPIATRIGKDITAYIDGKVTPETTYYYVLSNVDPDGTEHARTEGLEVKVPKAGMVSGIDMVEEDSGGKVLKAGDTLTVTLKTSLAGKAYFSLGEAAREAPLVEAGPGMYRGAYKVREGDGVFKSRISVGLRDALGRPHFTNSATFVSVDAPVKKLAAGPAGGKKPMVSGLTDDVASVVGRSGRLTAGRKFTVTITGEPGCKAFFNVGERIWKVQMTEVQGSPGVYRGEYTVKPGDSAGMSPDPFKKEYITGYIEGPDGTLSDPVHGTLPVAIDTTCDIKVDSSIAGLKADGRSQAKLSFTVTDADGEPVADRRLSLMLEPPKKYTGVVGGGGMDASYSGIGTSTKSSLGRLAVDFDDMTDSMGRMTATFTSGFAAKTAMVVARDYSTGSVGMAAITTSIASSVSVTLTDPAKSAGKVAAPDKPVYQLQIEAVPDPANPIKVYEGFAVSAVPDTLTADGVSRATIIATLTKDGVPVQGKTILFGVSGAGGSLTKPSALTDVSGRAQVFYIAGTTAGKALVTATEPTTGITATKVITLLADAPAKIYAKAYPDTLPADGASSSRIVVELADVNNNPTEGVAVSFAVRGGNGALSSYAGVTDARGACDFVYMAGRNVGVATVDISAKSEAPSADDMKAAYSRVVAPLVYDNYDFTELRVVEWYKSMGDSVGRGEPLALVESPLGNMVVYSPVAGTLDRILIDSGVYVMEGKEIGIMR